MASAFDREAAELLTLSSALGALQSCRAKGYYTSGIIDDTFYRLAAIARPKAASDDPKQVALAHTMFGAYQMSGTEAVWYIVAATPETDKFATIEKPIQDEAACRSVESYLMKARETSKTLDVKPAEPISDPPKKTQRA